MCRWLSTLGKAYHIYTPSFIDNGITGEMLLSLNHPSHYVTLGVTNNLHIRRIDVGVRELRSHVLKRRDKMTGLSGPGNTQSDRSSSPGMIEEPLGNDRMEMDMETEEL